MAPSSPTSTETNKAKIPNKQTKTQFQLENVI